MASTYQNKTKRTYNFQKKLTTNLTKEFGLISIKGLTKKIIKWYTVLEGAKCFANKRLKSCLIFQPMSKTFPMPKDDTETIITWKSRRLLVKTSTTPGNCLSPKLKYIHNSKITV